MKKRVLQLIGSFHQGGSERQAVLLTRLLHEDGRFDVFAVTLNNQGVLRDEIESIGLPTIPEFPLTSFYNPNFVRQVRSCAAYLRENKIDLVHTHDFYTNVFGMAAASIAGVKARVASKRETAAMRTWLQDTVESIAFDRADAIVANANAVRTYLVERGVQANKITVIHNGLDLDRFSEVRGSSATIRQSLGLSQKVRLIMLVANLRHEVKNVPMFLRVAKRILDGGQDAHFVIAGEGELVTELKKQADELNLSNRVHFIGRCTDVPALLSTSHACVLTSDSEGFSNSILEYMAAGRPVVATNVGGAAEALTDESGFLVAPNNDEAMASRLVDLLTDPKMATEMGLAGQKRVAAEFSMERQLEKTIELYERLL